MRARRSAGSTTVDTDPGGPRTVTARLRIPGVDVARAAALFGMMAVHVLPLSDDDGGPTLLHQVVSGRSAATFVLVAGVGLAFLSGGRDTVRGRDRTAVAAGLAVRAALIGALGLVLELLGEYSGVSGILPLYGLMFLLAIPLLGLASRALAGVAAATIALGPVLLVLTADAELPGSDLDSGPTLGALVGDPLGLLVQLTVTGTYPAVVYLAYLCAGLAIGRLDLGSRRVGWWLVGAGAALAVTAQVAAAVILGPLGGLARLLADTGSGGSAAEIRELLWEAEPSASWWYLALPAPHSGTPVDVVHTLGSAMVVLGAALLLTRVAPVARLLRPLAVVGSMALTLYTAHLLVLSTGLLSGSPPALYLSMVAGSLLFAHLWHARFAQGPLEGPVSAAARRARRGVGDRLPVRSAP